MIRNILWDVDGTLFDTYPAITYAISKSLNGMGIPVAMNVVDRLVRQSFEHCVVTISQRFKLDPDLLRRQFAESYRSVSPLNQPPFPGVDQVCKLAQQRGGLNMIVTHRSVQTTQCLLDTHRLAPYFADIFSVEQGYLRKPSPAMVLAALDEHGLDPGQTLLIGDREIDIQAGQAAGTHTCLFGSADIAPQADFHFDRYTQLHKVLVGEKEKMILNRGR